MKLLDTIACSLRSMRRKKMRTVLTLASIAIGVASVVLISSIGSIGREAINDELGSLGLDGITVGKARKSALSPLRTADLNAIRSNDSVQAATGLNFSYSELYMRSLVANGVVWGIDDTASSFISLKPLYGRMISQGDVASAANVCVVDQNVANAFYKRENIVGKKIEIAFETGRASFTVVGVVRSGGNILQGMMSSYIPSFVYIPYSTMQELSLKTDFDQIAVRVGTGVDPAAAGESIIHTLESLNGIKNGYSAENIAQQKETLNRLLDIVTFILSLIAGISLVVAGLGIMTVMLVSVNERTHEIGIKKSIGASRPTILLEFLVEAFTITLLGSVIGAVAGIALVCAGCGVLGIQGSISVTAVMGCVLFSVLVGVVFGVYPASLASRLKPVEALRRL